MKRRRGQYFKLYDQLQCERWSRLKDGQTAIIREMELRAQLAAEADRRHEAELNFRLAGMNEFRGQMSDQIKTFASSEKVDLLTQRLDRAEGKSGGLNAGWGYIVGGIGVMAAVVTIIGYLMRVR